jgi:hypothetical protein
MEPRLGNRLAACVHACSSSFARIGWCPSDHPFKVVARVRIPLGALPHWAEWMAGNALRRVVPRQQVRAAKIASANPFTGCSNGHTVRGAPTFE